MIRPPLPRPIPKPTLPAPQHHRILRLDPVPEESNPTLEVLPLPSFRRAEGLSTESNLYLDY